MRYLLAILLAIPASFVTHMLATRLLGIDPGLEAQVMAVLVGILVGAGYEQLAREGGQGDDEDLYY